LEKLGLHDSKLKHYKISRKPYAIILKLL